ncbi:alginate lyase family protein [Allocoleopsis sp.]|uniref:alginate lyase family protein n=1 Tax=Allocoleopsis sp. TaxID=3088169 RepID=UPI002FCF07E9
MVVRLPNWLRRLAKRAPQQKQAKELSLPDLTSDLASVGLSFDRWYESLQGLGRLYVELSAETIEHLRSGHSDRISTTITAANHILAHQFDLLGSGKYTPIDPERAISSQGYRPIDWYLDPVSKLRFPQGIPHKEWNLFQMRPSQEADIKLPWELARCQHWVTLGQAYRLTNDDRYAWEIAHQLYDFREANPVGIGIHWTCTMDVALRALNWALAFSLIGQYQGLSTEFWQQGYEALFEHGVFIYGNLENNYEVTSNHFLSNVVGLYYLASVFRDLPQGSIWNQFCRDSLEQEIQVQVLDDGADYESSVPYHRLVTELFLGAARLARFRGEPLSEAYCDRLYKMVNFLVGVMRPDGLMPQVGDADDGRLHIFTDYGTWQPQDARHLLAPAAFLLNEPAWLQQAGVTGCWEAAWWGFEIGQLSPKDQPLPPLFKLFPQAGLAVMREGGHYLLVSNGVVGTKGFGNHKHNDQLSFEYHADGIPLLVDPGSYVYTSDFATRNLFRSTGYHNTLCIDQEEQNEMRPEWIFRLFETAYAESLDFRVTEQYGEYWGKHSGYQRLSHPVTHERRFRLEKASGALFILDRLSGTGKHQLVWHFHGAPGVEVTQVERGIYQLSAGNRQFHLRTPETLEGTISDAWYSPSYGVRLPCRAIDLSLNTELKGAESWFFAMAGEACFTQPQWEAQLTCIWQSMALG